MRSWRRADRRAPQVIVNSPEFLVGDDRRIGVLPPGIDLALFRPEQPTARVLTIGTIGGPNQEGHFSGARGGAPSEDPW